MPELQMPDIAGNFLSSYYTAQQKQQADADRQRNMQRQDQADEMARQAHALKIGQEVVDMLGSVGDGDVAGFERAKQRWAQMGLPPEAVAGFTAADLPMLRQKAGTQLRELQLKNAQLAPQLTQAQIAAANRSNRGGAGGDSGVMKAPAGYQWTRNQDGAIALSPITGGPADPNKLAPGEAVKVRTANAQLDALEQSLKSYISDLDKTTPMGRLISRGPEVSAVETGHTDLLMQMKNLYELGVLNGPDYTLMLKIVEDPTGFGQIARGTEGLKAQTDTVKSIINRSRNINAEKLGKAPAATAPAAGGGEMNWTFDAQGNLVPAK